MQRRRFLAQAAAGMALTGHAASQPNEPLLTSVVPSSGERVPRLGLGTWQVFDVGGDASRRRQLAEVLRAFAAAGGRIIDTSPMYGTAESVLGDLVAEGSLRDKLWLATKVWTSGVEAGERQMAASLGLLRTSQVELMQVHNLVDWRVHLRTLRTWKDQGRVKYIGVTHYQAGAFDDLERVVKNERLDFVQLNLSLDEPQAADRMLGLCAERGVAFIANRPFGGGGAVARARGKALPAWAMEYDVTTWAQFLLKWVLSHEEVTCAIPGTSRAQHVDLAQFFDRVSHDRLLGLLAKRIADPRALTLLGYSFWVAAEQIVKRRVAPTALTPGLQLLGSRRTDRETPGGTDSPHCRRVSR